MVILLFGASGSAGGGVLSACLDDPGVSEVRAIVRRPLLVKHKKLTEFTHADFLDFTAVRPAFVRMDACFYCLGISTTQVAGEAEYRTITHDYALAAATTAKTASPGSTFHFISGQGAALDSRFMWARVKAETERDLGKLVEANSYRPAYIDGRGSASEPRLYKLLRPLFRPLLKPFPQFYISAEDIGRAMLAVARRGFRGAMIPNRRIRELAAGQG